MLPKCDGAPKPKVPAGVDLDEALHLAQRAEEALTTRSVYPGEPDDNADADDVSDFYMNFYMNGSCSPDIEPLPTPVLPLVSTNDEPDGQPRFDPMYFLPSWTDVSPISGLPRILLPDTRRQLTQTRVDGWMRSVLQRDDIVIDRGVSEEVQNIFKAIAEEPGITVESSILGISNPQSMFAASKRFISQVTARGGLPYVGITAHPAWRWKLHLQKPNAALPLHAMHVVWASLSGGEIAYWERALIGASFGQVLNKSLGGEGASKQLTFLYVGVHWPLGCSLQAPPTGVPPSKRRRRRL